jgi:hypothetical protein
VTNKEREILAARLAQIDSRRAELEMVLASLPPRARLREDMEAELRALWRARLEIAEQLDRRAA